MHKLNQRKVIFIFVSDMQSDTGMHKRGSYTFVQSFLEKEIIQITPAAPHWKRKEKKEKHIIRQKLAKGWQEERCCRENAAVQTEYKEEEKE